MPTENQNSLIQPVPVQRDEHGYWTHPDYPKWDEETSVQTIKEWYEEQGLEHAVVLFEDDAPEDLTDAWEATGEDDCTKWEPTVPKGDGWFALSIHDTERGPVCIWVRREASA